MDFFNAASFESSREQNKKIRRSGWLAERSIRVMKELEAWN